MARKIDKAAPLQGTFQRIAGRQRFHSQLGNLFTDSAPVCYAWVDADKLKGMRP